MGEVSQHRVVVRHRVKSALISGLLWKVAVLLVWLSSGCATTQFDAASPWASEDVEVPLFVHVATTDQGPVVALDRIEADVARTNAELEAFGIRFVIHRVEELEIGHAVLQAADRG